MIFVNNGRSFGEFGMEVVFKIPLNYINSEINFTTNIWNVFRNNF